MFIIPVPGVQSHRIINSTHFSVKGASAVIFHCEKQDTTQISLNQNQTYANRVDQY